MKKVFILNPLIYGKKISIMPHRKRQPLSLGIIAGLLKDNYQIKFLDANALGLDVDSAVAKINEFNPDFLILTSSPIDRWECPNSFIDSVFKVINNIKGPKIILTGSHGSTMPDWIFEKCNVDFVVRGEPELVTVELVNALAQDKDFSQIEGLAYKDKDGSVKLVGDLARIDDLDLLPMPAYEMMPMAEYQYTFSDLGKPFSIVMTSRGCPFSCVYCLKVMAAGNYVSRSPEKIVNEINHLVKNFGVKSIFFQDWEFMLDRQRVIDICNLIITQGIKIKWGCNGRAPDVEEKVTKKMKEAGCVRINVGFESGSQKILDNIKKGVTTSQLAQAVKVLRASDINFSLYTLLGSIGETRQTIKETVEFLAKNQVKPSMVTSVIPVPGTELFSQIQNKDNLTWDKIEKFAGRVGALISPWQARFWFSYYKYQFDYGRLFFLSPSFWIIIFKKFVK